MLTSRPDGQHQPGSTGTDAGKQAASPVSDFPVPRSLLNREEFIWDEDELDVHNFPALGQRLAAVVDLFRCPRYSEGLILASEQENIPPAPIVTGKQLARVIADRVRVRVMRRGNTKGSRIRAGDLDTAIGSEIFLQQFLPVDDVVRVAQ